MPCSPRSKRMASREQPRGQHPRPTPLHRRRPHATSRGSSSHSWPSCSLRAPPCYSGARFANACELGDQQLRVQRRNQLAQRLETPFHQLDDSFGRFLARKALGQEPRLFPHELLERSLVAHRVVDREADLLAVAARTEACYCLDDPYVGRGVATGPRGQAAKLGEPVEHLLRELVTAAQLRRRHARLLLAAKRVLEDAILELDQRTRPRGLFV